MDCHSHNLLESYYTVGLNQWQYKNFRAGENEYTVTFTRTCAASGVETIIDSIVNVDENIKVISQEDLDFIDAEIDILQNDPKNGEECQLLGYTYLGHMKSYVENISAAKAISEAKGECFKSIFYTNGYFIFANTKSKLFYDQG